jgi:hypothetical protein
MEPFVVYAGPPPIRWPRIRVELGEPLPRPPRRRGRRACPVLLTPPPVRRR